MKGRGNRLTIATTVLIFLFFFVFAQMSLQLSNLFSVRDKVCLVTGGSRGIGEWIASAFVQNGAKVYICSRKAAACDKLAAELNELGKKYGGSCDAIPADLSKMDGIKKLAEALKSRESRLDVLVNSELSSPLLSLST